MRVLFLLVLIAVVVAIPLVFLARRRGAGTGTSSPAEFLVYVILVGATLVATNALSSLLELVMPGGGVLIRQPDELALSLSTLLVAGIVAVVVWLTLERQTVVVERPARALYISAVTGFSMAVVAAAMARLGLWVFGQTGFPEVATADLVAFAGSWLLHERLRRREVELDDLRSLAGTIVGLILAVGGFGLVLEASLSAVFESGTVVSGPTGPWEGVITGFVLFAVGVPFLWWFWFRNLVRQATSWRDGYATAIALGAWFVGVTALAALTYAVLATLLGLDRLDRFSSPLPIQITTFVAAGLVYWHHRGVLGRVRTPLIRLMHYAFSAFGFVVGAGGLVTLVATLIENLTDRSIAGSGSRAVLGSAVAVALAALVIWRYWLPAQSLAGDPTEQRALPRRLAIVGLLTGSALVVAGALIAVLFVLLRSVLGSDADVSDVLSWAVPLTLVAGGMAGYFAGIRPRRAAVESAGSALPVKVSTVTVVAADPGPLPKMVEGMRFLRRSDGVGAVDEERAQAIIAALAQLEARAALVQVNADSFDVIPLA